MCWVFIKLNMAHTNQIEKLQHMARINNQIDKKMFSRSRRNPEKTYTTDNKISKINKRENTSPPTSRRGNNNRHTPPK